MRLIHNRKKFKDVIFHVVAVAVLNLYEHD